MELIDFDKQFKMYLEKWLKENQARYKTIEEMEDRMADLYLNWRETPFDWLNGLSPIQYFQQYNEPELLVEWLLSYVNANITLPDMLMDKIIDLGDEAEPFLLSIINAADVQMDKEGSSYQAKIIAIQLLNELQAETPLYAYIEAIQNRKEKDELADAAAEALINIGKVVVNPILDTLQKGLNEVSRECFIDILTNFTGDNRVFQCILEAFKNTCNRKALYASYLGKYNDERAIPVLEKELRRQELDYLDYISIRDAIEELGGIIEIDRDFGGDQYFDAMKDLE